MNIEHLKTFHCVARVGNFTQAARDLFLTQPAVSMQIQNLEHNLGVVLFDRSRRRVALTSEGEILYGYTRKIFSMIDDMQHEFNSLNELNLGHLKIGATTVMGSYFLPKYLASFFDRHPNIQFDFSIDNSHIISEMVYQRKVELGFCGSSSAYPGIKQHFLHMEPLVLVAGKRASISRARMPLNADEIMGERFIMREQGTRMTNKLTDWFKKNTSNNVAPSLITVDSMMVTKQLVINNLGVTALPSHVVSDELESGQMVRIYLKDFDVDVNYFLIYMPEQKLSRVAKSFLSLLFEHGLPMPDELLD